MKRETIGNDDIVIRKIQEGHWKFADLQSSRKETTMEMFVS